MSTELFDQFSHVIQALSDADLNGAAPANSKLRLAKDGHLEVFYAPFEYINAKARVVLVGITPGRTQMFNALREARRQLNQGADTESALIASKSIGAFSGPMRPNLSALLDRVGMNRWLNISTCDELFGNASDLVQTTSVLRNPVFINGCNYNGTPNMTRHPLLKEQLVTYFGTDAKLLSKAVFIPLGDKVAEALYFISEQGLLDRDRILDGLPHPSGANAERIAFFLGRKKRSDLSSKTNGDKLDSARESLTSRIMALA